MDNSSSQPLVAEDPSAVKGPINLNKKPSFVFGYYYSSFGNNYRSCISKK